jgi:Flp pilus assembly CpaE family ATPase
VFFAVPNDYPAVIASVNRGKLLRESAPNKEVTKSFRHLSDLLVSPGVPAESVKEKEKGRFLGRIFPANRRAK